MKITMSFDVGSAEDLAEARKLFERLSFEPDSEVVESLPPPAPPPPGAAPPAPPPPAPPPPGDLRQQTIAEAVAGNTPQIEVDSAGRPWDEKFHAKSKNKIKDGTWRRKRGVTQEEVEAALAKSAPSDPPAGAVPRTPPLAPAPPAAGPAANGEATWDRVIEAFHVRTQKYSQEQIQTALRLAGVEPTTLHESSEKYGAAIAALEASCPM